MRASKGRWVGRAAVVAALGAALAAPLAAITPHSVLNDGAAVVSTATSDTPASSTNGYEWS